MDDLDYLLDLDDLFYFDGNLYFDYLLDVDGFFDFHNFLDFNLNNYLSFDRNFHDFLNLDFFDNFNRYFDFNDLLDDDGFLVLLCLLQLIKFWLNLFQLFINLLIVGFDLGILEERRVAIKKKGDSYQRILIGLK